MIGTLIALGWIKQVPEYLREHPEAPQQSIRIARRRIRSLFGGRRTGDTEEPEEPPASASQESGEADSDRESAQVAAPAADRDNGPDDEEPTVLRDIDWFDPEQDS